MLMLLVLSLSAFFNQYMIIFSNIQYADRPTISVTYDQMFFLDVSKSLEQSKEWLKMGPIINAGVTFLLLVFLFKFYSYQKIYAENIDKKGITASDFTIMIENVHANDTEEDIRAYLRGLIGNRRDLWSYSDRSYQEILD
jgi:hypothetical protein